MTSKFGLATLTIARLSLVADLYACTKRNSLGSRGFTGAE